MTTHPTPAVRDCLTDENAQDIIDTASYGGITYWAGQPTQAEFDALPEDKTWTIVDAEGAEDERQAFYLNADDIREAYSRLLDIEQPYVNRTIHGYIIDSYRDRDLDGIDCGHIDADAADVIVQLACFGEIVYG